MLRPADCQTKDEIRAEIDRLDRELVALLADRFSYVRRMAQLKTSPAEARDSRRVDEVLARVVAEAGTHELDRGLIHSLWQILIDWNIAWEAGAIGKDKGAGSSTESGRSGNGRPGRDPAASKP